MKKLSAGFGIGLLILAALIEWGVDQKTQHQLVAEEYIGDCEAIEFPDSEAYQSEDKTAIIFTCDGYQGQIEAMIVLANDSIESLVVIKSNEGLDRSALNSPGFSASFQQKINEFPLEVDAVTGATISSQILIDAVHGQLTTWLKKHE